MSRETEVLIIQIFLNLILLLKLLRAIQNKSEKQQEKTEEEPELTIIHAKQVYVSSLIFDK